MTPTSRSLEMLRKRGGIVAVVERWNPYAKIRVDLWGFVDIVHIHGDMLTLVQTTSGANASARIAKIRSNENYQYIGCNCPRVNVVVHAWRKVGARGKRKVWKCREIPVTD